MKTLSTLVIVIGIFGNLFGQSKSEKEAYQQNWVSYFTNIDGKISSVATDLNLDQIAPIKKQLILSYISVKMNTPRKNGLSSHEESNFLWEIEDSLISKLNNYHLNFSFVGRITSNGYRDLYFFSNNKLIIEQSLLMIMIQFPGYKFDIGSQDDPNWKTYFEFLYPLPQQIQSIENHQVLANLQDNGDDLTKEREVFHWVYFKTESELNSFEKYISKKGFQTISKGKSEGKSDYEFMILVSRIDKVGYNEIDAYTLELWKKAKKLNGEYDGWETSIVK